MATLFSPSGSGLFMLRPACRVFQSCVEYEYCTADKALFDFSWDTAGLADGQ